MASSSKKKSTSKTKTDAKLPGEAKVVDAVVIEETDADAPSGDEVDAGSEEIISDVEVSVGEIADDIDTTDSPDNTISEVPAPVLPVAELKRPANPFWALLLGGLVAACLGFVLARYLVPEGWPFAQTTELEAKVDAQAETIDGLNNDLATMSGQLDATTVLVGEQADQLAELETQIAEVTAQVNAEPDPTGDAELPADLAALLNAQKEEISSLQGDLRSMAEFAEGQIETAQQEAEAAARAQARATARDALNKIRLALASGAPFGDALPQIAGATDVPAALSDVSGGVATQSDLQGGFGVAARKALASSNRELSGDSAGDRVSLFFQDMIGARSLTPQEGDSPDAVLSRAEASVQNGDLGTALKTLDTLPESGKADLTEWREKAQARDAALQAFSDLTDALSAD